MLDDDFEIDSISGTTDISRAEDLLANIASMLGRNHIDKKSIDMIAVSNGPGSYTGIRIGLATAIGLQNALGIPCYGVSLLAAMANAHEVCGNIVAAVPMGRDEICWQVFEKTTTLRELTPAQVGDAIMFNNHIEAAGEVKVLLLPGLLPKIDQISSVSSNVLEMITFPLNLAYTIGLAAHSPGFSSDLQPFYIQKTQTARDHQSK